MLKIYDVRPYDFMGYKMTKQNPYTYHHIIKKCDGGKETIDNGAILTEIAHEYLHIIEYKDNNTYIALSKILQIINNQQKAPTLEQYEIINALLELFEKEHSLDLNSKGKTLIREKYKKRNIII